jgi:hypothetical protein
MAASSQTMRGASESAYGCHSRRIKSMSISARLAARRSPCWPGLGFWLLGMAREELLDGLLRRVLLIRGMFRKKCGSWWIPEHQRASVQQSPNYLEAIMTRQSTESLCFFRHHIRVVGNFTGSFIIYSPLAVGIVQQLLQSSS